MSIRFSDRDIARGSDLSCYGSQRFPNITVRFGGGSRSTTYSRSQLSFVASGGNQYSRHLGYKLSGLPH